VIRLLLTRPASTWAECREYVEKCGGLSHEDGEPNWRAAFGADPGCCSCPKCKEMYWSWGAVIQCLDCGFTFPTDWWAMYSWGVQSERRSGRASFPDHIHTRRLAHPYYRYGFEHPVENPWEERERIDWKAAVGPMTAYPKGVVH
jgi:hypothetical protein